MATSGELLVELGSPPYRFESADGYSVITLMPGMNDAGWSDIEAIGDNLLKKLAEADRPAFLVDLTLLSFMGSAVVALIVRLWKSINASNGKMVVHNTDPMVLEVLEIAGLTTVWTVVTDRDDAVRALGKKPAADRGKGFLTLLFAIVAFASEAVIVSLLFNDTLELPKKYLLVGSFASASAALVLGTLGATTYRGWKRFLCIIVIVAAVSCAVAGSLAVSQ